MIYVGIDVTKGKYGCFITNSDCEGLFNIFTIPNNANRFHNLYQKISSLTKEFSNVKVELKVTGYYNYNLLGFLMDESLPPLSSIPYILICSVKVSALDRLKQIR